MLHIALYQPMIPPNVGNAGRTCVGFGMRLHLIGPHRLDYSEHAVKRAGLDYWAHLNWQLHDGPDAFIQWVGERRVWLISKFGEYRFDQPAYADEDVLVFGNEKEGLPDFWMEAPCARRVYVPIVGEIRSFNLANTVAMVGSQAMLKTCPLIGGQTDGGESGSAESP
jgi:tRNA (cytidine/uridine-2'-O-)-methyltransferase